MTIEPAHSKGSWWGRRPSRWVLAGVAVCLVAALAAVIVATAAGGGKGNPSASGAGGSSSGGGSGSTTTVSIPPLAIISVTPIGAATGVSVTSTIQVEFSDQLSPGAARPTLSPAVAGNWAQSGSQMTFTPTVGYIPDTKETVTVPAGVDATDHNHTISLASAYSSTFTVGDGSTLRLQEMLAELGYLPLAFTPSTSSSSPSTAATTGASIATGVPSAFVSAAPSSPTSPTGTAPSSTAPSSTATTAPASTTTAPPPTTAPPTTAGGTTSSGNPTSGLSSEPTTANLVPVTPLSGTFSWAYPNTPPTLTAAWSQGQPNEITRGAVMAFEADHNMAVDGDAGPMVWTTMLNAVAARQTDQRPYDYLFANQAQPETLTVWQNGQDIYSTPANTGISDAQTTPGTFAVYERLATQVMKGTNPDGSPYADPVSFVAYFNASEAVHYIDRSSYGSPQSLGCIELPYAAAQTVYGMDYYGTLVTITSA